MQNILIFNYLCRPKNLMVVKQDKIDLGRPALAAEKLKKFYR